VILVLGLWEWQARAGVLSALFFPAPTVIMPILFEWLTNGKLAYHLGATLSRVLTGFFIGAGAGLLLGLLMGWSDRLRNLMDPFIAAAHPMPKIAILPLIMIIFGIGETSKVVVIAVASFFPMVINTMAGVRQISPLYFDVARNYGAGPLKVFLRIIIPGSLPLILTGTRIALNLSLLLAIAVELTAAQEGLGVLLWLAWETLRTEELYASLAVIAVLGIICNVALRQATGFLLPWRMQERDL
jgi:NitT/TauT family transport system permease protein